MSLGRFRAQIPSRHPDRFDDLVIPGATAEVPRQRLADVLVGRVRLAGEQVAGGEEDARDAVAALRRPEIREGFLQGVELPSAGQALYRLDVMAGYLDGQHQTGKHRLAIDQHGACSALTQLTAVLGASQAQLLAQDLEQCVMRRSRNHVLFAIDAKAYERTTSHVAVAV